MNPMLPLNTLGLNQDSPKWFPGLQAIFQDVIDILDGALIGVGGVMLLIAVILMIVQSRSRRAEGTGAMFVTIIAGLIIGGMAVGIVGYVATMGAA